MKSFLQHITMTLEEKKQSFLRGVKYRGGNPSQDHKYEFEHEGKNAEGHSVRHPVEVDFDTMPSDSCPSQTRKRSKRWIRISNTPRHWYVRKRWSFGYTIKSDRKTIKETCNENK